MSRLEDIDDVRLDVRAYYGPGSPPEWMDLIEKSKCNIICLCRLLATDCDLPEHIRSLCTVSVDKSIVKNIAQKATNKSGSAYWWYNYDLIINFGGTEMTAQILWNEGTSSHKIERRRVIWTTYRKRRI